MRRRRAAVRAIAAVASNPRWRTVRAADGIGTSTIPAAYGRCVSKACTLIASRSASTRVKINACRSLCALISSAQELVVRGGGDCQRESVWPRRRDGNERLSIAELLATSRAEPPPGLLATVAAGAEQQIACRRCPVLDAHRASLAAHELSIDARSPICGQSRPTTQIRGPRSSDCVILDRRWR